MHILIVSVDPSLYASCLRLVECILLLGTHFYALLYKYINKYYLYKVHTQPQRLNEEPALKKHYSKGKVCLKIFTILWQSHHSIPFNVQYSNKKRTKENQQQMLKIKINGNFKAAIACRQRCLILELSYQKLVLREAIWAQQANSHLRWTGRYTECSYEERSSAS